MTNTKIQQKYNEKYSSAHCAVWPLVVVMIFRLSDLPLTPAASPLQVYYCTAFKQQTVLESSFHTTQYQNQEEHLFA